MFKHVKQSNSGILLKIIYFQCELSLKCFKTKMKNKNSVLFNKKMFKKFLGIVENLLFIKLIMTLRRRNFNLNGTGNI